MANTATHTTEQTLSIIKPDAVGQNQIGNIIEYFEREGLNVIAAKMLHLSKEHAKEFYDVDAYYDQVYKGYTVQQRFPHLAEAVDATSGMVAAYNDELIVAAYFSRGDGMTRSYKDVWKKEIPYLVSVETPYTKGKAMSGHGVGIDATDAYLKAKKDSWTFDQLLKYYYTGISLEKIY